MKRFSALVSMLGIVLVFVGLLCGVLMFPAMLAKMAGMVAEEFAAGHYVWGLSGAALWFLIVGSGLMVISDVIDKRSKPKKVEDHP